MQLWWEYICMDWQVILQLQKGSEESVIASDIIENIGKAYRMTRES